MHYISALAAIAAVAPFVSAHDMGIANMLGFSIDDIVARRLLSRTGARFMGANKLTKPRTVSKVPVQARQDDRQCGQGIGSCATGECCSPEGCMFPQNDNIIDMLTILRLRNQWRLLLLSRMSLPIWPGLPREPNPWRNQHLYCSSY